MTALQGDLCGRLPDGKVWSGCRVGPERQEPAHRCPWGARWLEDSGGKSGRQRDERGAHYRRNPDCASQFPPAPDRLSARVQLDGTVHAFPTPRPRSAHLTGVSVMLVTAFPSKVFWPAMDWAVAILSAVALVARLSPAPAADESEQEPADSPY